MEKTTVLFWLVVVGLFGAATYFGTHAERDRRELRVSSQLLLDGQVVSLVRVVDGDSVVVAGPGDGYVAVRLVGIKAAEGAGPRSAAARWGSRARAELQRLLDERSIRIELNAQPTDRFGRTLATLFVDGQDVGLELVRQGLVQVYTRYAFERMPAYLREQEAARAARLGLWGDRETARRAELLARQWEAERE